MKNFFGFKQNTPSLTSPKIGGFEPNAPQIYKLKSLHGQIFNFDGVKEGDEFVISLENMEWSEEFLKDYVIFNALDLYVPSKEQTPP